MSLIIREADNEADLPAIISGAISFAAESGLAEFLPDNPEDFVSSVATILSLPSVVVLLAVEEDRVVGGLGMNFSPSLWNLKSVVAEELFFWTEPNAPRTAALRLLRAAEDTARDRKADVLMMAALVTSPEKVGEVYIKRGLRPTQMTFMRRL